MVNESLILGFVGGLIGVLGGVWTAYRMLSHALHRELNQQQDRITQLENIVYSQNRNANDRMDREMTQRHQGEMEAQDGRANLSARLLVVESEIRRRAADESQED